MFVILKWVHQINIKFWFKRAICLLTFKLCLFELFCLFLFQGRHVLSNNLMYLVGAKWEKERYSFCFNYLITLKNVLCYCIIFLNMNTSVFVFIRCFQKRIQSRSFSLSPLKSPSPAISLLKLDMQAEFKQNCSKLYKICTVPPKSKLNFTEK